MAKQNLRVGSFFLKKIILHWIWKKIIIMFYACIMYVNVYVIQEKNCDCSKFFFFKIPLVNDTNF